MESFKTMTAVGLRKRMKEMFPGWQPSIKQISSTGKTHQNWKTKKVMLAELAKMLRQNQNSENTRSTLSINSSKRIKKGAKRLKSLKKIPLHTLHNVARVKTVEFNEATSPDNLALKIVMKEFSKRRPSDAFILKTMKKMLRESDVELMTPGQIVSRLEFDLKYKFTPEERKAIKKSVKHVWDDMMSKQARGSQRPTKKNASAKKPAVVKKTIPSKPKSSSSNTSSSSSGTSSSSSNASSSNISKQKNKGVDRVAFLRSLPLNSLRKMARNKSIRFNNSTPGDMLAMHIAIQEAALPSRSSSSATSSSKSKSKSKSTVAKTAAKTRIASSSKPTVARKNTTVVQTAANSVRKPNVARPATSRKTV